MHVIEVKELALDVWLKLWTSLLWEAAQVDEVLKVTCANIFIESACRIFINIFINNNRSRSSTNNSGRMFRFRSLDL